MQKLKHLLESEKQKEYRPIPFWSWNDKLQADELKKQISWMNDNGIGGFFMHARSGLKTEYMSEEWMECIETCVEEAEKRDMKAWLYDENGWPSGFAGGKLLAEEKNRDQYILYAIGEYDKDSTVSYLLTETQLLRTKCGDSDGEYLNLYIKPSASTVDILNPKVVEQFLALTHEKYKARFGKAFEEKVEGFFTDEPQYYRYHTSYTVMLEGYWQEHFEEDIFEKLGLLFVEKEGYRTFRYRYWKALQELMLKNYAETVYTWCENNGVKLTGHYVEEVTMGYQMMCCGGAMPFYEFEHIPGIDWLGRESTRAGELSAKQVGSVAAQVGRKRVITETFGCCGWDISPADLKRIAGFQYVNGVNMMCHHLLPYSERGNRKYDYPAHYSEVNPWVKEEFKVFNDYFTRLGCLLGEGKQHVNVAMFHPIRSTYFTYQREVGEVQGFGVRDLDDKLAGACRVLSSHNIDYHFVDETLLAKYGFVEEGRLGCGKCVYDYLVFPDVVTMDRTSEKLIRSYVAQGGKVLLLGEVPTMLEGEEYEYDYLTDSCTLDEIVAAQPFACKNTDTEIFATYRTIEGTPLLYVINGSAEKDYVQHFQFGENVRSLIKYNLMDGTAKRVPLTIELKPGEDAVLIPDESEVEVAKVQEEYELRFKDAQISWKQNYLPVDNISYSKDGIHYSEPWPSEALFQKLLKEEYRGKIYFKYEFDIKVIPEKIYIRAEKNETDVQAWLNGCTLQDCLPAEEVYVKRFDVTKLVRAGKNEYIQEMNWYEDDFVYYALFGENVTESLRNCVVYDSELQPIWLEGEFGVFTETGYQQCADEYLVQGEEFYIGAAPERVTEPVVSGFPFLAGEFSLKTKIHLPSAQILLKIPGEYHVAEVKVNGVCVGKLLFEKELDISNAAVPGENVIEVRFIVSNRNLYGPYHYAGGRNDDISPWSFQLSNTWNGKESPMYKKEYILKKHLYVKNGMDRVRKEE